MASETSDLHRIIVVGGGAGGLELVTRLGNKLGRCKRADVTFIDKHRAHLWKSLLARRLTRAHQMLSAPRHFGETISAIAYAAGFADLSHFNRSFRRRYGCTPSDVRMAVRRAHRDDRT